MSKGGAGSVKETPEERALADVAAQQMQRYGEVYVPLENQYMKDVRMTPDEYQYAEGQTATNVNRQFGGARAQGERQLAQHGIDGGSGHSKMALARSYGDQAKSLGVGRTDTENQVENLHYRGLENVVNMGMGINDQANLGLSQAAQGASQRAGQDAWRSFNDDNARAYGIGVAGGAVTRGLQSNEPNGIQSDQRANGNLHTV